MAIHEKNFWARVDKAAPNECWLWRKWCDPKTGYGRFRNKCTHRLAFEFTYGDIPAGWEIDHTCFVRSCCNPRHLRMVTGKQNKENRKGAHGVSGIRGVRQVGNRWRACVVHNRKYIHIGYFSTPEEADEAATLKRLELFTHSDMDRRAV